MQNLVALGKRFILSDHFQEFSVQRKIFSRRRLDDIIKNDSPSLEYFMRVSPRGPNVFTQFTDIQTERKQDDIVDLLLNTN